MNKTIEIQFRNGNVARYKPHEYTEYKYDGKCFIVINEKQWIGMYNLDCIEYVEVTEEEAEEEPAPQPEPPKPEPASKPNPQKKQAKPFDTGKAKALREGGWTLAGIAKEMNCSQQTVANHLKKIGMK